MWDTEGKPESHYKTGIQLQSDNIHTETEGIVST